jgi:hypothetical protein
MGLFSVTHFTNEFFPLIKVALYYERRLNIGLYNEFTFPLRSTNRDAQERDKNEYNKSGRGEADKDEVRGTSFGEEAGAASQSLSSPSSQKGNMKVKMLKRIVEDEVEVNLRPTVSRSVCPSVRRPSVTCDQFFFRHEISFRQLWLWYFVAPSLTRGRVCNLLLNCFWALPEQSLLSRSPAELTAIFYCHIFETI